MTLARFLTPRSFAPTVRRRSSGHANRTTCFGTTLVGVRRRRMQFSNGAAVTFGTKALGLPEDDSQRLANRAICSNSPPCQWARDHSIAWASDRHSGWHLHAVLDRRRQSEEEANDQPENWPAGYDVSRRAVRSRPNAIRIDLRPAMQGFAVARRTERPRRLSGAPGEIRTPDPLVRSQMLYPAELRAHALSILWHAGPYRINQGDRRNDTKAHTWPVS
jgi:hypothetical protein